MSLPLYFQAILTLSNVLLHPLSDHLSYFQSLCPASHPAPHLLFVTISFFYFSHVVSDFVLFFSLFLCLPSCLSSEYNPSVKACQERPIENQLVVSDFMLRCWDIFATCTFTLKKCPLHLSISTAEKANQRAPMCV